MERRKSAGGLTRTLASTATLKLATLGTLDPFYTPLEERFERITRLARRALSVPVAAITVVKGNRQWFQSVAGWDVTEIPTSDGLCNEVIETGRQLVVEDTLDNLSLMSNPYVCNNPRFRFYAGFPMKDSLGDVIGTFCVMDVKSRKTDSDFESILTDLGDLAQHELLTVELSNANASLVTKLGEARRKAMFDSLTRLWNRRGGIDLLNAALKDAVRQQHSLGICMADIDNFKKINDRFGHQIGDQVLRKVASQLVASVRPHDTVCRYGGEEFLIIVRDVNKPQCMTIANRMCQSVSDLPIRTRQMSVNVTLSVGVSIRSPGDPISTAGLIEKADSALYQCKRKGRNQVAFG